jgi:hypothetical protein
MSNQHDHPLWHLADQIQMDLRAATAKLVQLRAQLANITLPDTPRRVPCPDCAWDFQHLSAMQEHRYHHHDGPLPHHWATADQHAT